MIYTETFYKFQTSIRQADHNVLIIAVMALCAVLAWHSINLLPRPAQRPVQIIAWLYALLALALTVIYSRG